LRKAVYRFEKSPLRWAFSTISGVAYYTVERNGFRVVATLAETGEARAPMRFEAVLAPGQSVTFSTPGGVDVRPNTIEISRQNDEVLVHKAALTN
jgi:hypothetical protein